MEYQISTTSSINITQMRFAAQSGKTVSAAELAKLNARLDGQKQQMAQLFSKSANAVNSKMFVRVLPNDAAGNRVLASTVITTVPVTTPARKGQKATTTTQTSTVTSTTSYSPSGQVVGLKVTTSDAQLQKVYDKLDMAGLLRAQGLDGLKFYGQPLALNTPVNQEYTLDVQSVFGNVLGALGSGGSLQAQPLTMQVSTTLLGETGNLRHYQYKYTAQPWAMTAQLGEGKQHGSMRLSTDSLTGQSDLTYRLDGFPASSNTQQNLQMSMITEIPDSPYQMEMGLNIVTKTVITAK